MTRDPDDNPAERDPADRGQPERDPPDRDPDADPGEDPIVGDPDGISIGEGDGFDYALSRPDAGEFGFDAAEVPKLRELLDAMQGDG